MDLIVATLTAWIAAQTGLAAVSPPRVTFVEPDRLAQAASAFGVGGSRQIRAIYRQPDRVIVLRSNWNADSLSDRSELLHELVHHFQNVHDIKYGCAAEREELAYELQMAWLREQGIRDPYEFLQISALFVLMVSVCRASDHD